MFCVVFCATDRSSHFLTNRLGDTPEKDHAVSASSVDAAAACLRSLNWCGGFRGADGSTTCKPCIQKEQRAEGWGRPTAHRWKGEGRVGTGKCRKGRGGAIMCCNPALCCQIQNNWSQHKKCADWTSTKRHGQNRVCTVECIVDQRYRNQYQITQITPPTSETANQSEVLNIAELESIHILQPSGPNHRWWVGANTKLRYNTGASIC